MHFHIMRPYISICLITPTLGGIFLLRAYKIWYKIYKYTTYLKQIYVYLDTLLGYKTKQNTQCRQVIPLQTLYLDFMEKTF